ncbi:MAG: quinoprotein relay system zinc metallohydrolase 2 [Gammaproteobacteria bacterium]|nr:quinoprotein relay system zinc metallohydrolase 2 [Gammaproteobacteria bacterium]
MRILTIKIFLFLLVAAGAVNAADVLSVNRIADGVYVHWGVVEFSDNKNHGAIANIGFIVGERCVAVIDSGGNPEQGAALRNAIEKTTDKPICYVINTHVHPDHIYGNAAFKSANVKFVGHDKLARAIALRKDFYLQKAPELLGIQLIGSDLIPPDITVNGEMELDLGKRVITLTAHPAAHTDNDLSVYDRKTDTLWLADLLFTEHIPSVDGSLKGWLAELEKLQTKSFKRVVPGHGNLVSDWPGGMQPQKEYLNTLLMEVRTAIKKGVYLEDAVKTVGLQFKDKWRLFDDFHRKNVTKAYAELEWED